MQNRITEREGFEPSVELLNSTRDFQSRPFGHSGTSPKESCIISFKDRFFQRRRLGLAEKVLQNNI